MEVSMWAEGSRMLAGRFFWRFSHYSVIIAFNWLAWTKHHALASYSVSFSHGHRLWPSTYCAETLFHPTAFSLGRMFGQRQTGSSCRHSIEWWTWRRGRMQARSQLPSSLDHHPCKSKCVQITLAAPLPEKWAAVCHFLPSPFPSPCHIQFQNRLDRCSRALNSRWTIWAGNEFIYSFSSWIREKERRKGGEPECWQCNLVAKSVFKSFSHSP